MANILVRNIEDSLLQQIKLRARENGWSLQNEIQQMLLASAQINADADDMTMAKIKELLKADQTRRFSDSAASLREDRAR